VTQGSSLPPLKKNDSKYGLIAFLLLLASGALWFFLKADQPEPDAGVAEPPSAPPTREQFAPEIEIPAEDAAAPQSEDDEATAKPSRPARPEDWECLGTLDAAQIRDVINGPARRQVQTCYERALKDDNLLQGSMTVLLTIGASGSVKAISVEGSLNDSQVYTCVRRVAKSWQFPRPQGGCVRTSVPFQMTPKL